MLPAIPDVQLVLSSFLTINISSTALAVYLALLAAPIVLRGLSNLLEYFLKSI